MRSVTMLMLMSLAVAYSMVTVKHGGMVITGYNSCSITTNGLTQKINIKNGEYVHPSFIVGLLKWKCDDEYGSEVIDIECKDCGLYCSYNQQFEKCRNYWAVPAFGILLSIMIFMILCIITMVFFKNQFNNIVLTIIWYFLTRNDRVRAKKVTRLNKMTGGNNPILFRLIITGSEQLNKMIRDSRMKIRKEVTGDEPVYAEICQRENEASNYSRDLEMRVVNSSHHRLGERAAAALVTGLAITSAASPVYACDKTLYLSSNGKICDNTECKNINMYSMHIQTGSTICFNTIGGEKIEMRIKDGKSVTRYQSIYYACSYKVETSTTYECKSISGNCWNKGTCYEGYKHPSFTEELDYPSGYGCQSDTVGCDTFCWHQTSCVWYKWVMSPIVEKCYKVYTKNSEIWQTSIFIKYKGITKHIKLNSNNPQYNLDGYDIEGLNNMPIVITSYNYESIHLRKDIMIVGTDAYEIDASMPNFPVKNTIGEFQMALDKKTYTAYTSDLKCQMTMCSGNCTYDQPAIERIYNNKYSLIPKGQIFKNGEMVIKRQIPIMASATMMIGSIEIDSLLLIPSSCKISVEQTIACTGCDTRPIAIFKAYDIKQEGLLEFETNCSWTKPFLSCNPEPYFMTLEQESDKCLINIKATNQTLIIDFTYEFKGSLELLKTYYAESSIEALTSVVSDKSFWSTLFGSLNVMAIFSVGSVALLKIARLGIAYKTNKDLERV